MSHCDPRPVERWLHAGNGLTAASLGFVIGAAVANNSFFGAVGSPGLMLGAAAAAAGAAGALGAAAGAAETYCRCLAGSCSGECANLTNALKGSAAVRGIQATARAAAAGIACIPWAGAAPMYVIAGALALEIGVLTIANLFLRNLKACGDRTHSAPQTATVGYSAHRGPFVTGERRDEGTRTAQRGTRDDQNLLRLRHARRLPGPAQVTFLVGG